MSGEDGGFVIVWMALMLLVLLAFCGFGIDVAHWWFVGQKEQRAADAAALAGSIYMPNDLPSAQAIALRVSAQNGYKNGVNATVTATQEPQPSRIRVTVRTTITNFFAGLVGYNTADHHPRRCRGLPGASPDGKSDEQARSGPRRLRSLDVGLVRQLLAEHLRSEGHEA